MKKQKPIKRRNRIEGQIAKLAQEDKFEALCLATHGRKTTDVERAVFAYVIGEAMTPRIATESFKSYKGPYDYNYFLRSMGEKKLECCTLLIDAVKRLDGDALRAAAQVLDDMKRGGGFADNRRASMLMFNRALEWFGKEITYGALLELVGKVCPSREVLKQIQFPLAKDKTGRPKKSSK